MNVAYKGTQAGWQIVDAYYGQSGCQICALVRPALTHSAAPPHASTRTPLFNPPPAGEVMVFEAKDGKKEKQLMIA